jgi:hypothetical protein
MGWTRTTQTIPTLDQRFDVNSTIGKWPEVVAVERTLRPKLLYPDDHRWWLRQLVADVVTLGAREGSHRDLDEITADLISDLTQDNLRWDIEIWLHGLRIDDIEISLGPGILLRRPTARDFETSPIAMNPFFDDRAIIHD